MVMPSGGGLVAPPASRAMAGRAREMSPAVACAATQGQPRGLGIRQPDGADAGRAALASADGHRRVAERIRRSAPLGSSPALGASPLPAAASAGRAGCSRTGRCG